MTSGEPPRRYVSLGLPDSARQAPLLEWVEFRRIRSEVVRGEWRVWLSHNKDFTAGTWLSLYQSGLVKQYTLDEDGTIHTVVVAP